MGTKSAQAPPPPRPGRRLAEALPVAMTTEGGGRPLLRPLLSCARAALLPLPAAIGGRGPLL